MAERFFLFIALVEAWKFSRISERNNMWHLHCLPSSELTPTQRHQIFLILSADAKLRQRKLCENIFLSKLADASFLCFSSYCYSTSKMNLAARGWIFPNHLKFNRRCIYISCFLTPTQNHKSSKNELTQASSRNEWGRQLKHVDPSANRCLVSF